MCAGQSTREFLSLQLLQLKACDNDNYIYNNDDDSNDNKAGFAQQKKFQFQKFWVRVYKRIVDKTYASATENIKNISRDYGGNCGLKDLGFFFFCFLVFDLKKYFS